MADKEFERDTSFEDLASKYTQPDEPPAADPLKPPSASPHGEVYFSNQLNTRRSPDGGFNLFEDVSSGDNREDMPEVPVEALNTGRMPPVHKSKNKNPNKKKKKSKKKRSGMFDFSNMEAGTIRFFAVVTVLSVALSVYAVLCINDILALTKSEDNKAIIVSAEEVQSTADAVNLLYDNGLIRCRWFCRAFARVRESTVGAPYTSGSFELNAKMGLEGMLVALRGDTTKKEEITLTFPEGYTVPQIVDKLVEYDVCDRQALLEAIENSEFSHYFLNEIDDVDKIPYRLEGYLFPATYDFYIGENPNDVLTKFLRKTSDVISAEYRERAEELGYTVTEILTIASIIEREAANQAQMGGISMVIHNRLNNQDRFPNLECNSTRDYITNQVAPSITVNSKNTASFFTEQYNTYTIRGLPPGPICNPGEAAIEAALYPDEDYASYYFFRHDDNGTIYWASNVDQHRQNGVLVEAANNS